MESNREEIEGFLEKGIGEMKVYYLEGRSVFHLTKKCLTLKNSKSILSEKREALKNRKICKICKICEKKITYNKETKEIVIL